MRINNLYSLFTFPINETKDDSAGPGRRPAQLKERAGWELSCDGSWQEGRSIPPALAVAAHLHCNENPIYVFPEKKLRGLSPNFHIPVSVSYLYIPRQQNRQNREYINRSQVHECGNWDWKKKRRNSFSINICFEFSVLFLCSVLATVSFSCWYTALQRLSSLRSISKHGMPGSNAVCLKLFSCILQDQGPLK